MKKITLFVLAALSATSAFAVVPQLEVVKEQMKLTSRAISNNKFINLPESASKIQAKAPEVTDIVSYNSSKALYLGLTPQGYGFTAPFGFSSAFGTVDFEPIFISDSYNWSWENYLSATQTETFTSTDSVLSIKVDPTMVFAGPTLNYGLEDAEYSYNNNVVQYFPGSTPAAMGLYHTADETGPALVTPVVYTEGVAGNIVPCIDYTDYSQIPGAESSVGLFSPTTGCWTDIAGSLKLSLTDVKINAFGSVVPGLASPYTLSGGTIYVQAVNAEPQEVSIAVFPISDNKINFNDTIGEGSFTIPVVDGGFNGFATFEVHAVNEMMLNTGEPVVVPSQGVYLSIYGVNDKDKFTAFNLCYSERLYPVADLDNDMVYASMMYSNPVNAYLEVEGLNSDGKTENALAYNRSLFYGDNEMTTVMMSREYSIFYDIQIPYIACATQGFQPDDMTVELPVEGGQVNRWFVANTDLAQLIDDELVAVDEENGDWYEYALMPDEEEPEYFNLVIEAEALPEGVEGRKATISFKGYGYDSTITITQGTPASINEVVAAQAKNGKVYDLQGRVVKNATKGIYIMDGKKVIL